MILYGKEILKDDYRLLSALLTKCKISEDIINNIIAGHIKVKNMDAYDRIYGDLIKDTIAFDTELERVRAKTMGTKAIINGVYFHIFSARPMLFGSITADIAEKDTKDIESFLIGRGFEKFEIE